MNDEIQKRFCVTFDEVMCALETTDMFDRELSEECALVLKLSLELNKEGFVDYNDFFNEIENNLKVDKLGGKYSTISSSKEQLKNFLRPLKREYRIE